MFINKTLLIFILSVKYIFAQAPENCFIAKENNRIVKQIGNVKKQYSPVSTFKIPIALMGFDSGFLRSAQEPFLSFKNFDIAYLPFHAQILSSRSQSPATWMKRSVIWYSQEITKSLGPKLFNEYLKKFNFGNMDASGNPGQNDGLTQAWLYSSLKISAEEYVLFLEKLSDNSLPISICAQKKTKEIIKLEEWEGWSLYGKTGGGTTGWFVGWIEKDSRRIVFAQYVETLGAPITAGRIAKELAKDNLTSLIFS